jgi:dihydrofolate reductase
MINITLIVAISLDGKIAHSWESELNWTSQEDWDFLQNKLLEFDAIVIGKNTFLKYENRIREKRVAYVFSHEQDFKKEGNITWLNPSKRDIKSLIEQDGHKKVALLWGRQVYEWFLERDSVNEIFMTIEPIILGEGINFVDNTSLDRKYTLHDIKKLNTIGSILLHYIPNFKIWL